MESLWTKRIGPSKAPAKGPAARASAKPSPEAITTSSAPAKKNSFEISLAVSYLLAPLTLDRS